MFTNVLSIGAFIYGVAAIVYQQYTGMTVDQNWFIQNGTIGGAGLLLFLKNNWTNLPGWSTIKSFFSKTVTSVSDVDSVDNPAHQVYVVKDYQKADQQALLHLKNRLKGSGASLETWKKLSAEIIELED